MADYPYLDFRNAWRDTWDLLHELQQRADALWKASAYTNLDMVLLRQRIKNAQRVLGTLPPSVLKVATQEEAAL